MHVQQNEAHAKHLRTCAEYVYANKYVISLAHFSNLLSNEICYAYMQHLQRKAALLQASRQEMTGTTVHEEKYKMEQLHIKVFFDMLQTFSHSGLFYTNG